MWMINPKLLELSSYQSRHDEIATEMLSRGMNHKSPLPELPDFSYLPRHQYEAKVDRDDHVQAARMFNDLRERSIEYLEKEKKKEKKTTV